MPQSVVALVVKHGRPPVFKQLLVLLFIARVTIPMGQKVTYENVEKILSISDGMYHLWLADGRDVYVPVMFTVIEEKTDATGN